jgi:pyruvate formate lyase activating enzyme
MVSTYNEPLITAEWAVEVFAAAKAPGSSAASSSNGNATAEVLEYIRPYVSLYKVDLKGFTDARYRELGESSQAFSTRSSGYTRWAFGSKS